MDNTPATNVNEIALVAGTAMMLLLVAMFAFFVYLFQRKLIKRKLAFREIESLLNRQELKSTYALLEGQDMERQRVARELHDNIGSVLVTLNMYADSLLVNPAPDVQKEFVRKISEVARRAVEEVRSISHRLDATELRFFGLRKALDELVAAINTSALIRAEAQISLTRDLPNEVSLNIYRILQELVQNSLKHSHGSLIQIHITEVNREYVSVLYEDNGVGFQPNAAQPGMGLLNIRARAEKINARLTLDTRPQHGFSLSLEIPMT
jgi:signal transduction histidine kinase